MEKAKSIGPSIILPSGMLARNFICKFVAVFSAPRIFTAGLCGSAPVLQRGRNRFEAG